jgi:DNA polymerase-3 subunit alpha
VWQSLDAALEAGAASQRDREIGQASLFGATPGSARPEPALAETAEWSDRQRLEGEKEVLGFYVTGHPLAAVAAQLRRFTDTTCADRAGREGRDVRVGGIVTALRETRTRRGALMAFAKLEDMEGSFDLVVFQEPYARCAALLKTAGDGDGVEGPRPLLVSGTLEAGDPPKILVRDVVELERAEEKLASALRVRIRAEEATADRLTALRRLLEARPGECGVTLHVVIPEQSETVLAISSVRGVRPDSSLRRDVDALFGRNVTEISW